MSMLISCRTIENSFQNRFSIYDSCVTISSGNPKYIANLVKKEYYDNQGKIHAKVYFGGDLLTFLYKYDNNQKLIEEFECLRNCDYGIRHIMKYDSLGRLIGIYNTTKESINIDTCVVKQIYFYDEKDRLIREQTNNSNGYENWKNYLYNDNNKISEIETQNNDTIWVGSYIYDKYGRLSEVFRQKGNKFKNEKFQYDSLGRLVQKIIESDDKPTGKKIFSATNKKTIYKYDQSGLILEAIDFTVREDYHSSIFFHYEKNKNAR
jgi:YD repeat-containing protein